jgi:DNA-binding NarL/FixJ family response regulator
MTESHSAIRILIFEKHAVARFGLGRLLNNDPALSVVGETGDLEQLERLCNEVHPHVVLGDPGDEVDGLKSLLAICARLTDCRIIVYATRADRPQVIMSALDQGVSGYLLKEGGLDELLHDIHIVCEGTTVLAPAVADKVLEHLRQQDPSAGRATGRLLSKRELEVLGYLAQGKSNLAIAESLCICAATVKFHVHSILKKLDAGNRTEAVSKAVQAGFINMGLAVAQVVAFCCETPFL